MPLKLPPSNEDNPVGSPPPLKTRRRGVQLAPGAPHSPGPVPEDLGHHLVFGEALVWWDEKNHTSVGPVLLVFAVAVSLLGFVSAFAPEFWLQPPVELAKPIAALLSPALLVLLRERYNQNAVMVTDSGIVGVDRKGRATRVAFERVRTVRRDVVRGGLKVESLRGGVHIPPTLVADAQQAVTTQTKHRVRNPNIHDPMGWWP